MGPENTNDRRQRWKWPNFSLRTTFFALSLFAIMAAAIGIFVDRDEQLPTLLGAIVLGWGLFCWRVIRLNRNWFRVKH